MKKHYLLTIAAGLMCSMAASADFQTNVNPVQSFATRAATGTVLDSLIVVDANKVIQSKTINSYTKEGWREKAETFAWNKTNSEWVATFVSTYTYDEQGRMLVCKSEGNGLKKEEIFEYKGNEGAYTVKSYTDEAPMGVVSYKGNTTYDDQGNCLTLVQYVLADVNGDGMINSDDKKEDGSEAWFKEHEESTEYDEFGKILNISQKYYENDELAYEITTSNVWDGESYEQTSTITYVNGQSSTNIYKYEVTGSGSIKTSSFYMKNKKGDWDLLQEQYLYYSEGGSTANETIVPAPAIRVSSADGAVRIETAESLPVQIFAISGQCYYNATVNGQAAVSGLPTGIYVVRAGKQAVKVSVR